LTCKHNPSGCECHELFDQRVTGKTGRFKLLLRRHGGCAVETSRNQIMNEQPPSGFGGVAAGDSMESFMIEPQYDELFSEVEINRARGRLRKAHYDVGSRMAATRRAHECPVHPLTP
jgi:hypothetical protein